MAMFCIEDENAMILTAAKFGCLTICVGAIALTGCTQSVLRLSPDFGQAVRQDTKAQIADPDAHYVGTPAPGSNGQRAALAQQRYDQNQVVQPTQPSTSSSNSSSNQNTGTGTGSSGGTGGMSNGTGGSTGSSGP
jgi:uncharacterized membrane protein YgcG